MFSAQDLFVGYSLPLALKCVIFTERSPTDACESSTSWFCGFPSEFRVFEAFTSIFFLQFTSAADDAADPLCNIAE